VKAKPECTDLCRRRLLSGLLAGGAVMLAPPLRAAEMDHSAHKAETLSPGAMRSEVQYRLPAVRVQDQDGNKLMFDKELDDGRPVILNFIFTTCTAICPVMTQIFAQVQAKLGPDLDKVHMVSVSIDPEYDTPKRLMDYALQHNALCQLDFYTGTLAASHAIQKAFNAYRGDKMNHTPLTLMRAAPGKPWVRIDGFATPGTIVKEFRALMK
jgi:protein SCO1/2